MPKIGGIPCPSFRLRAYAAPACPDFCPSYTLRRQLHEVEPEIGILKKQLVHLVVADGEYIGRIDAFHRLRAATVRRQQAELTDKLTGHLIKSQFGDAKAPRNNIEHRVGDVSLAEQELTTGAMAAGHVWFEPVHRLIAARRVAHPADKLHHLHHSHHVQWK